MVLGLFFRPATMLTVLVGEKGDIKGPLMGVLGSLYVKQQESMKQEFLLWRSGLMIWLVSVEASVWCLVVGCSVDSDKIPGLKMSIRYRCCQKKKKRKAKERSLRIVIIGEGVLAGGIWSGGVRGHPRWEKKRENKGEYNFAQINSLQTPTRLLLSSLPET